MFSDRKVEMLNDDCRKDLFVDELSRREQLTDFRKSIALPFFCVYVYAQKYFVLYCITFTQQPFTQKVLERSNKGPTEKERGKDAI